MKINTWIAFAAISMIFFAIQATHFTPSISDENTYIYMAKEVAGGSLPYRDFFLAHPPLSIILLSAVYAIFGLNIFILKAAGPIAIICAAAFMFAIAKKHAGTKEAIVSVFLFYFSYDLLRFSTFATWTPLAVMLTTASIYLLFNEKTIAGGIVMGLAGIAGFLSLIAAITTIGYLFFTKRNEFLKFTLGFALAFGAINILLFLAFNGAYATDTVLYHLSKPSEASDKIEIIKGILERNPLLFASAGLFIIARRKMKHAFLLPAAIASSYLFLIVALMGSIFGYYFLFTMPFLAILGGKGIVDLIERIGENRRNTALLITGAGILAASALSANGYLTNTYQNFEDAQQIAAFITDNAKPDEAIFGDDSIVPLIAMLSNRKIAFNDIDSNSLRWRSGLLDINKTMQGLRNGDARFVIERRLNEGKGSYLYGLAYIDTFKAFLKNECNIVKEYKTPWKNYYKEYYIYDCISSHKPENPTNTGP